MATADPLDETLSVFDRAESPTTPLTATEVADGLDCTRRTAYNRLERLAERGDLETKKVGARGRVWWRPLSALADRPGGSAAADSADGSATPDTSGESATTDASDESATTDASDESAATDASAEPSGSTGGFDDPDPRLSRLVGNVPGVVYRCRNERGWPMEFVSEQCADLTGYDADAVASGRVSWGEDLLHPDDRDRVWDEIQAQLGDGDRFTVEYRIRTADGATRWVRERGRRVEDGGDGASAVEGVVTDVTDRRWAERALRESEQGFRSLVTAVEEYAIFRLDPDGTVASWNEGAERIKGYDADEILGEHVSAFYTDEAAADGVPERNLAEAAREGSTTDEGWRVRADGTRFWANVTVSAIRDDDGDLLGFAKVTRDMTDERYAEAERTLLYSTTRSIAEAGTFEEGLRDALREVCETTDWEFGEAWVPTDGTLERADADYAGCADLEAFAEASEPFAFERGEGLPGRVWASGDPEWVRNANRASEATFVRAGEADRRGLGSALGVPVATDDEVVAVLVLGTTDARPPDDRMVELLSSVGTELAELVERQRAEDALDRETELTERILEASRAGIAVFDADGNLVRANERMADLLGEFHGGSDADLADYVAGQVEMFDADGDPLPTEAKPAVRAVETGDPVFDREVRVESAAGRTRWLSINATPLADDGRPERVVVTASDVTRLKEQTRRLERQREDLRRELDEVFERVDDAFFALDDDWRFTYVNERAASLPGVPETELLGRHIWDVFERDSTIDGAFAEAMETQEPLTFEVHYAPLEAWFEASVYPSESGLSVHFRDVTDRKERQHQLEEYRRIVETVDDGVYVANEDGEFTLVNDAYAELVGYDRETLLGSHVSRVADDETVEAARETWRDLRDGDGRATVEADLLTADGERVPTEATFSLLPTDEGAHRVGVVRDVTERRAFEETLTALHDSTRQLLRAETPAEVSEVVVEAASEVLDLPGVVVYRRDADGATLAPDAASVEAGFMRREFPEVPVGEGSITGWVFDAGDPCHYDDILDHPHVQVGPEGTEMRTGSFVPMGDHGILVAGSASVGAFDHRTRRLTELFAANAEAAYDRVGREEQLDRQRERLAALDELNGVVRDINEALVRQSTREEVERVVCERLAEAESYEFAWFGEVDPRSETVELRTEAGVEDYLDGVVISVDPDDDASQGPTGQAVLTEEVQVSRNVTDDPDYAEWRDHARTHGFRSSAAIPVVHEGTLYGVLNVYAGRPDAFAGEEREVIGQLGEVVGHAIASIDRKRALMSDEAVELEFRLPDVFDAVGVPELEGTVSFDRTVPVGDGAFVAYGTASDGGDEVLEALVENLSHWDEMTVSSEEFGTVQFELRLSEPPVLSAVAAHGGYVEEAVVEDGDYRMTLAFPPTVDVRSVVERVREAYPAIEVITRRQVSRSGESLRRLDRVLTEELTDRQRTALEAAYFAGFFEWPRERTAREVADSLDVADATFHQHLRLAEGKLLSALFEESATGGR